MTKYNFNQLVDIGQVQKLLESHRALSKMSYGFFEIGEDNLITIGWRDICVRHHRSNPVSCARCRESIAHIKEHLHKFNDDFLEYRFKNGMIEIALPIIINGELMATLLTGHFFYYDDLLDKQFFVTQVWEFGFDFKGYLKALDDVPIFSREHVRGNILFLRDMLTLLAEKKLTSLNLARHAKKNKLIEEGLPTSELEFRTLAEKMLDKKIHYDRQCRAIDLNPILPRSPSLEPANILDKIPMKARDEEAKEYDNALKSLLRTEVPDEFEMSLPTPSVTLSIDTVQFETKRTKSDEITGVKAVGLDITEREQIQKELLRAKSLESLSTLTGGIAHDLGNLLMAITGHLARARRYFENPSKVNKSLKLIESACQRATELARRLTAFAKSGDPVKTRISLQHLIEESMSLLLKESNVLGEVYISDTLHDLNADETQISQVFNNIIINAAQAMPQGGKLTIRAENAAPKECRELKLSTGPYIRVSFTDEGCGITEDNQQRLFEPCFTTKPEGTGMGLTSCLSIVTRHGGRIVVSSKAGIGTTFTIYLPSHGHLFQEHTVEQEKPSVQCKGRVLVMDDEQTVREAIVAALNLKGYSTTDCSDGLDAFSFYKAAMEAGSRFETVIMDLNVENGMGGKEAALHILEYDPTARLIASSGDSGDPIMVNHAKHGFYAVLTKPYSTDQLARVVRL